MREALALVEAGASPTEASERLRAMGRRVSARTIYRAMGRQRPPPATEGSSTTPQTPAALPVRLETVGAERAAQVRRLVASGEFDARTVGRLALTWGCSHADVRGLLAEAAVLAGVDALPLGLALEESVEVARRVRKKAEESADWKSVLAAQAHIDRAVERATAAESKVPAGHVPRADVVALLRRVAAALHPWPEAVEAFRGVVSGAT